MSVSDFERTPLAPGERVHFHIPTPGDHFSAATGSAIPTIIYEIACWHDRNGGETRLTVGRGTRHDYPVGECIEVEFPPLPDRPRKAVDAALGRLGMPRWFGERLYAPASEAIPADFTGPIFLHNNPVAIPLLKKAHPKAQVTLWANNELFRTYSDAETRRVLGKADRVICCSQYILNDIQRRLGAPCDRLFPVNNGVNTERFQPRAEPLEEEIPTVLFIGRVLPEKGPDLLLKAAQKIRSAKRKFKVRIVGSSNFNAKDPVTPYQEELLRLAEPLGTDVEFHPFVDRARVIEEYQAASIFCVPSNWDEPMALTLSEGMACGLPVIASRRGGMAEVGGDDILYFLPPDVDTFADHLAMLIDDPKARQEWGARARQRVLTFSWERQYRKLLAAMGHSA
jgi:glycosyltransferase involved in cell wall biosynthesis